MGVFLIGVFVGVIVTAALCLFIDWHVTRKFGA